MTEFDLEFDAAPGEERIAYIKPTGSAEAHRLGLIPPGIELPPNSTIYVLHAGDGSIIGVTDDYDAAYGAAVQNEFRPVSLH